jgi:hypothetical protein
MVELELRAVPLRSAFKHSNSILNHSRLPRRYFTALCGDLKLAKAFALKIRFAYGVLSDTPRRIRSFRAEQVFYRPTKLGDDFTKAFRVSLVNGNHLGMVAIISRTVGGQCIPNCLVLAIHVDQFATQCVLHYRTVLFPSSGTKLTRRTGGVGRNAPDTETSPHPIAVFKFSSTLSRNPVVESHF